MKHIRKKKRLAVLPDNDSTADIAASGDAAEGIRQGMEDVRKGKVRPAKQFFKEFEAQHGLCR